MVMFRSIRVGMSMLLTVLAKAGLAHEIAEIRLPPYDLGHHRGYATLRVSAVDGSYILAFATSQYNIMRTENPNIRDPLLILQRDHLLDELKDPSKIVNLDDFGCRSVMVPNVLAQARYRQKFEEMSFRYVKPELRENYADLFSHITAQYKLSCKEQIEPEKLKYTIFQLAPKLETILFRFTSADGKSIDNEIKRN